MPGYIVFSPCYLGVLQVVIESGDEAKEYESVVIEEGSPINPDMGFDRAGEHIYVMTLKQVGLPS